MDKTQKEFTDQIRSAIKAKLSEINAFVDDELPDYIMILVANKRSKSQIAKDLNLFLGGDTLKFTDWLWDMVKSYKLKGKSSSAPKKDEAKKKTDKEIEEDNDVLDCDVSEHGSDILDEDVQSLKKIETEKTQVKDVPSPQKASKESTIALPEQGHPKIPFISPLETVQPFQSEDEYDPTKPHFSGCMSSVVQISPKNYGRPASLQPNKLLLRAVNDATKSVLNGQNVNDFYKPTPINVLSSHKKQNHGRHRNLVNIKIDPDIEYSSKPNEAEDNHFDQASDDSELHHLARGYPITFPSPILNSESADATGLNEIADYPFQLCESEISDQKEDTPHFIVTLDGVDYSLKRKYTEDSDEAMEMEEDESVLQRNEDSSGFASKKPKLTKCKYWPSCLKSVDECDFFHPTVPCKTFPECKFGDQCLYIHPDCKFDALCSRKDCPFTHASKRKFSFSSVPKPAIKKQRATSVCRFYPKCTASKCPFIHPKPCRYGTKCRSPVCPFSHFNIPARNQLIWKANA